MQLFTQFLAGKNGAGRRHFCYQYFLPTLASLLITNTVFADCSSNACVDVYVDKLYVTSANQTAHVATSGDETKLDCTAVSGVYTTLYISDPSGEAIYSLLLAAQLAGKTVQIRIDNGSPVCKIRYVTLDRQ